MSEATNFAVAIQTLSVTAGIYDDNARTFEAVGNAGCAKRFAALRDELIEAAGVLKKHAVLRPSCPSLPSVEIQKSTEANEGNQEKP